MFFIVPMYCLANAWKYGVLESSPIIPPRICVGLVHILSGITLEQILIIAYYDVMLYRFSVLERNWSVRTSNGSRLH